MAAEGDFHFPDEVGAGGLAVPQLDSFGEFLL